MTSHQLTLPAFPLKTILLPGETTRLHIFEERYKELVKDCMENNAPFAIPFFDNGEMSRFGCEVKIKSVIKDYTDGRKDILIEGLRIFKILNFTEQLFPKLYGAALIEFENANLKVDEPALQDAIIHYFSDVQGKILDYESVNNLTVYNVAGALQLSAKEKLHLAITGNKQIVLLNLLKFVNHIISAEQKLNNRFIYN
jgi:Lon protease-like protein